MHRVVPELIIANYRAGYYNGEFPAVGMFLDLSGFSTMTDVLMQHGQHGAEVLAGLMHGVFDPLVESVFDYGGKIVGFAGDGIMALYPITSDVRTTALRAVASAFVIQKRLTENPTRQTVYGKFPITARIGLAIGSVSWCILCSDNCNQATYYFRGDVVNESAEAEHHARAGDILLTNGIERLLQTDIETTPCDSFQRLSRFCVELPDPTRVIFPPVDLEISRLFMPEEVIAYDVRGEFRQVVNLFMRFPDLAEADLQSLIRTVFELRDKYGGLLNRLDFGDKGCNMLILWGAPVAYENDILRALNFLLELKSRVDFPITAGVTDYIAHAGYLGSVMCEDYTCYGWGVNLASRFMMSAPSGEIWVDDRIARRISKRFEIEFIGTQLFKGFAVEQKVYRLLGSKKTIEPIYQGELAGRDADLARLADFIGPLWQNKFAGVLLIAGDAGIGKGRLVYEFRSSKLFAARNILWAVCQSDQILHQSFNPLRNWLANYFGISQVRSSDERKQIFNDKLDRLLVSLPDIELKRELDRTRSVLGALLDLRWDDSLYEQLDAAGRYNNTFLALIALFKAESLCQPVVIFFEDLQFTDKDSKDFLPHLKRAILAADESYPIAVIVTTRPPADVLQEDLVDSHIQLGGLSREAIAHLTETMLGGAAAPNLITLLLKRSEGNPYFVEQFIRYLQEENLLETSQDGWSLVKRLRDDILPGDIRSILVARLDQLVHQVKETIQTASVLGREFETRVLSQMLSSNEYVQSYVDEAEKAAIWAPLNELRYVFSHGLLRDAAYEMQMRARRQELHALAVEALESLYVEELNVHYAELAYHAEHADLRAKAQTYYSRAGKASADQYQNSQAIDYFTRALAFTPSDDLEMQFDLLAERVELFNRQANRLSQLQDLDSLEKLAHQLVDPARFARMLMLRTVYDYLMGNYQDTITHAAGAHVLSDSVAETSLVFLSQITWFLSLLRLGKLDEAMQQAQHTLKHAREIGEKKEIARVLNAIGLIAVEQKEPSLAHTYFLEAHELARETKDRALESRALNNLAISEGSFRGDYATAREYYEQAYRIAREIGDRNAEGFALGNLAFTAGMQGDFVTALQYHERSLSLAREAGNRYHETYTLINLSAVKVIRNDGPLAQQYAWAAAEIASKDGERSGEAWAMLYLGHAYMIMNEIDQARYAYQKSLEIRNELGQPALSMEPLAGLIDVALCLGDLQSASQQAEKILTHLDQGGTLDGTDEPFRVYHSCYVFLKQQQDPRAPELLKTGVQLLEARVSKFKDEKARKMYVENVPWRHALQQAAQALGSD